MIIQSNIGNNIGVAVDVGSTSIGVSCLDLVHKTEICSFSFANPQQRYGLDVITRIKHCIKDKIMLQTMHTLVDVALYEHLKEHLGELYDCISMISYSGNTIMLHILREFSLDGFVQAPFKAVDLKYADEKRVLNHLTEPKPDDNKDLTHMFLPCISPFVGADILVGAQYLQMGMTKKYELLIDLGTNGELFLLNCNRGFATSTACGPVFDHAIKGAVYGSESMNVIANCLKRGLIDPTGKLADAFFDKGIAIDRSMTLKQEHIRDFQLAKGAIYAGIQCLLEKASIEPKDVSKVYISGGLGFYLNQRDAFTLKLLPDAFKGKIEVCENTSLEGTKKILLATKKERMDIIQEYETIRKRTDSFELANHVSFQDVYMNSLEF